MTVTPAQLVGAGRLLENIARKLPDVRRHVDAERRRVDGYPTRGERIGGRSTAELTPVEAAAEQLLNLSRWLDDIEAGLTLLVVTVGDVFSSMDRLAGMRVAVVPDRCNGKVRADCDGVASEHRHPTTGATVYGLCDACWLLTCPTCHERPPESRRGGLCEACYKRNLRSVTKGAA